MMGKYSGLIVSPGNIAANYRMIQERVGRSSVIAVVKADAYGHGMEEVVTVLEKEVKKPLMYAVAKLSEALALRAFSPEVSILLFEPVTTHNVQEIISGDITGTLTAEDNAELIQMLGQINGKLKCHIKVNTGMNRLGIDWNKCTAVLRKLQESPFISCEGIYTHLADSDNEDVSYTEKQINRFDACLKELQEAGINPGLRHAANSGGIWFHPKAHYDAVRPGISLYGYYPSHQKYQAELLPAMELRSYVESIRLVEKDESVSYAKAYISAVPMRVATIPLGYADGIPRNLSNKLQVIIGNNVYWQIGRITMDRIIIDIKDDPVKTGAEVILLGWNGALKNDAWDWANELQTIPYEITCSLNSKRMTKFYKI